MMCIFVFGSYLSLALRVMSTDRSQILSHFGGDLSSNQHRSWNSLFDGLAILSQHILYMDEPDLSAVLAVQLTENMRRCRCKVRE
jgi:hypothetical protein